MPEDNSTTSAPNFARANELLHDMVPFIKLMQHQVNLEELEKELLANKDLPDPDVVWALAHEVIDMADYLDMKLAEEDNA